MIYYPSQVKKRNLERSKETPIVTGRKETATKTAGMVEWRTETRYLSPASKVAGRDVRELPLAGMEPALAAIHSADDQARCKDWPAFPESTSIQIRSVRSEIPLYPFFHSGKLL